MIWTLKIECSNWREPMTLTYNDAIGNGGHNVMLKSPGDGPAGGVSTGTNSLPDALGWALQYLAGTKPYSRS